jgi:prepilin-type N-terminal cleavage/methylation domain-containing protein
MRSHSGRPSTVVPRIGTLSRPQRGFSLIELLVTIVLAGIIFAAMVPFFANALSRTSGDNLRNVATNIAQDRIEQVRLLGSTITGYASISQPNLNFSPSPAANPFGDGRFGPIYPVAGDSVPYNIQYGVDPAASPQALQKMVTVTVTRAGLSKATTMSTIIKNPDPGVVTGTSTVASPSPTITGLSITAMSFKNWNQVGANGITVRRVQTNVTPNVTYTPTPLKQIPTATNTTVTWTNLTGGMAFTYTVSCHSNKTGQTYTSPPFHLLKPARLKFDTNPGGM